MITNTNGRGYLPPALRGLKYTLADLERRFGENAVIRLGQAPQAPHLQVEAISTGYPALDAALGVGGLPRGRITEIYGPESSGKTTICLNTIARAQLAGGLAIFIDTEHSLDPTYAAHCGVDITHLYFSQPQSGEEALEIAEAVIRAGAAVVVIDSTAALLPRAELEGEMGDNYAGLQSRLVSQALRKLAGPIRRHNSLVIFTSQLRTKSGQLGPNPEISTAGRALLHYTSIRLELRRLRSIKSAGETIGSRIQATVKKNKVAPPYRTAEFDISFPSPPAGGTEGGRIAERDR